MDTAPLRRYALDPSTLRPVAMDLRLQMNDEKLRINVEWEKHMNKLRAKRRQPTEFHRHKQAAKMRTLLPRLIASHGTAARTAWPLNCYTGVDVEQAARHEQSARPVHPSIAAFFALPACKNWRFCEPRWADEQSTHRRAGSKVSHG